MKTLKLDHDVAQRVLSNGLRSTWRLNDDKKLVVHDEIRLLDKVDAEHPETWTIIGTGRIERIIEKRLQDITAEDMQDQGFATVGAMLEKLSGYYDREVSLNDVVKIVHIHLTDKKLTDDMAGDAVKSPRLSSVQLYTDGGSRGNPGPSASGYVIIDPADGTVLVDNGIYLGVTTNNQAEYLALKYGLEEARKMGVRKVACYLDSMLVVNQMSGIFKVSNRDLWPVHAAIKTLAAGFDEVTYTHVPREMNKLADAAVNRALDEGLGLKSV